MLLKHIKSQNPLYKLQAPEFKKYREAFNGGTDFKNKENIRKFYSDRGEDYESLLNVTPVTNLCRNLIENRVATVFEMEPVRHLYFQQGASVLDKEQTPGLLSFLNDCTFQGQEFDDFMEEVATQAAVYGHCWVYMDKPAASEIDVENPNQNRPYLQMMTPMQVLDWKHEYVGGREVLSYIKFIASDSAESTTFVVMTAGYGETQGTVQTFTVSKEESNDNAEISPTTEAFIPAGMPIPCVKVYSKKDPTTLVFGQSDIKDAVYFQRFVANLDREAYESIIYKKSILKLPSEVQTPEGGGMGIVRGDIEELAAVEFAVPDTADIDSVRDYINNVLERYTTMNGLQSQTGVKSRSGESFYQERQSLYRLAGQKARNLEVAEVQIFDLFAQWQLLSFIGSIEYDTDYSERDVEMKLYNLKLAREIAPDSASINTIVERELIKLIGSPEDIKAAGLEQEYKPVESNISSQVKRKPDTDGEAAISYRDNGTQSINTVVN